MITQAIKRWLRNVFAWWPWKHTPLETYRQASGPLGINTSQEGISRSAVEGTTAQASITPRLSTIEERPEHPISAQKSATNDIAETPLPPSLQSPADSATEPGKDDASSVPTPQQRLEFLRYLVERGIINEGSEEK
ncbi:MAG TPA: hypothetical protein VIZ18_13215 [Ktedonobacteraceae bacterium]